MNRGRTRIWLAAAVTALVIAAAENRAQDFNMKHATGFSSDVYFDAPNDDKVQMRLSGTEAAPLSGGRLDIKGLQVETFSTNGVSQMTAESPRCTYRVLDRVVESPDHLELKSGDGKIQISGDGFQLVMREDAKTLMLSNHVHTVIHTRFLKP
jgi:hypothetical protein